MVVCFTLFSVCYIFFFFLMKHERDERVRTYALMSQFSTKISVINFKLFSKICCNYFWVTLSKTLVSGIFPRCCWDWRFSMYIYNICCSEAILIAADQKATGLIYLMLLFECMNNGCVKCTTKAYLHGLEKQRTNSRCADFKKPIILYYLADHTHLIEEYCSNGFVSKSLPMYACLRPWKSSVKMRHAKDFLCL